MSTQHFIDEDFKFQSVTIGIEQLLDQTAAGHAQLIENLLSKHEGLIEKERSLTSDNASVMKLTARLLNVEWLFSTYSQFSRQRRLENFTMCHSVVQHSFNCLIFQTEQQTHGETT